MKNPSFTEPRHDHHHAANSWNDQSSSLNHQQKYMKKLQKLQEDILSYDHEYQKQLGQRVAEFQKTTRDVGGLNLRSHPGVRTFAHVKKQPYFNIEMTQSHERSHFKRDPCFYAVKNRPIRSERLKPLSYRHKQAKLVECPEHILQEQLHRLEPLSVPQSLDDHVPVLPKIFLRTPRNTPASLSPALESEYFTRHRLASLTSRDITPFKHITPRRVSPICLQKEKTDYESFDSISARNQLNIDDYFHAVDDTEDGHVRIPQHQNE